MLEYVLNLIDIKKFHIIEKIIVKLLLAQSNSKF